VTVPARIRWKGGRARAGTARRPRPDKSCRRGQAPRAAERRPAGAGTGWRAPRSAASVSAVESGWAVQTSLTHSAIGAQGEVGAQSETAVAGGCSLRGFWPRGGGQSRARWHKAPVQRHIAVATSRCPTLLAAAPRREVATKSSSPAGVRRAAQSADFPAARVEIATCPRVSPSGGRTGRAVDQPLAVNGSERYGTWRRGSSRGGRDRSLRGRGQGAPEFGADSCVVLGRAEATLVGTWSGGHRQVCSAANL
jgi:hypothetical protein